MNPPRSSRSGLSRRKFLGLVSVAAAAVSGPITAKGVPQRTAPRTVIPEFSPEEATISTIREALRTKRLSSEELVRWYQKRIEQIDQRGPHLRSVLELNPEALRHARAADQQRRRANAVGPLHGIPVLLKDNIETHDLMTTTAGSVALQGYLPARDAFLVEQLRRAGAILLGKTNLSEWANFRSNRSSSGWSARGGQTLNPYVLDRSPCGSSSGSAVAVAANLATASIGTETDGSIVCPASVNGTVGLKPTVGLVSRGGIIPIAHSQDTAGPICRSVADAAILLGVITGSDVRDGTTGNDHARTPQDYTKFLEIDGLRGARLGVMRRYFGFHRAVDRLMDAALEVLKKAGAELIDPVEMPSGGRFSDEFEVLLYEFKHDLNMYLSGIGEGVRVRSLEELIRFNEEHREVEMPYFGQEIFIQAQAKGPLSERAYRDALEKCRVRSRTEGIDAVLNKHQLDAILAPTTGPAATIDLLYGDHGRGGCSSAAAVAGYPHLTVPAGHIAGLPVGLSFFAGAFSEGKLIRLGYAFEQATRHRQRPQFLAKAPVELLPEPATGK